MLAPAAAQAAIRLAKAGGIIYIPPETDTANKVQIIFYNLLAVSPISRFGLLDEVRRRQSGTTTPLVCTLSGLTMHWMVHIGNAQSRNTGTQRQYDQRRGIQQNGEHRQGPFDWIGHGQ
ncbi:MAG: hypothetical protein QNI89_12720 [Desulfobacterales bacterium]|nr:hypothetical protein [Desulfobacterales bacterium]